MEKGLSEYIQILEKLFIKTIENCNQNDKDISKRLDNLINLLVQKGIPPEEIEKVLSLTEPYDLSLEQLKNDLFTENLPDDINNDSSIFQNFYDEKYKDDMIQFFNEKHQEFEKYGVKLEEDYS